MSRSGRLGFARSSRLGLPSPVVDNLKRWSPVVEKSGRWAAQVSVKVRINNCFDTMKLKVIRVKLINPKTDILFILR